MIVVLMVVMMVTVTANCDRGDTAAAAETRNGETSKMISKM